jgi:hypothetical protein
MRRLSFLFVATALLLAACNNNKKTTKEEKAALEEIKDNMTTDPSKNPANNLDEMQKAQENLQKLPPLSLDQLKALIPEQLLGAKRSSYSANSAMGTGVANAEYRLNDTSDVKLMVYDCGGPAGAGIYGLQYMGMFNMESETEHDYTKTISYNGGKAFEHCQKDRNDCTLTFFGGNRFLVTLEGNNVGIDALKEAGKSLKL